MVKKWVAVAALCAWAGCQPPPPVGRAANPTPPPSPSANKESAELLKKVDALEKDLKERPKNFVVKKALGRLYFENERFVDAASMFRQALDERPDDAESQKFLANCLFFLGNPDMAIQLHNQVIQANPRDVDALFFLGAILVEARSQDVDSLKRALEAWGKVLEIAPEHPRARELSEQMDVLRKAIKGEISLGRAEQRQQPQEQGGGEPQQGQGAMGGQASFGGEAPGGAPGGPPGPTAKQGNRVASLAPSASKEEKLRAQALDALDERRFMDAKTAAEAILQTSPDDLEMGVARARSLVQLGEVETAIRSFGEVIKRKPNYSPAWHYLGMAHMLNNDPTRAAQTWNDLIQMDPAYADQHKLRQRAAMAARMAQGGQ